MSWDRAVSLRSRIFLIVLVGAVLPLALLGLWITGTAERSGEALLRERLETSLGLVAQEVGLSWLTVRGEILRIAELPEVQAGLQGGGSADGAAPRPIASPSEDDLWEGLSSSSALQALFADLQGSVEEVRILDAGGEVRWRAPAGTPAANVSGASGARPLPIQLGIFEPGSGRRLGTLDIDLRLSALLSGSATWGGVAGSLLGAFEPGTGASLLPPSIDPVLLAQQQFQWRDESWLAVRRQLQDPRLELVLAAPVAPFADPFRESARRNLWILAVVTMSVLGLATLLTRRTTKALARLADAAEAVAQGDLDREVDSGGRDEVGRVGRAFNAMTESLRRTLQELSQRRALAAVGEFAASLAHEVRNPLTSIRVDLQRIEEKLPEDEETLELMTRTLRKIDGLNRSVTGALQVARSGSVTLAPLNLRTPLKAAVPMAEPTFQDREAKLEAAAVEADPIPIHGDAAALERLFLKLLLNAAQALGPGGKATVAVEIEDDGVRISIQDDGKGIEPEDLERIFDPFFSTRPDGTGLGLPISQRIAQAHGGDLSVESELDVGTTVTVLLPQ
jgi:signal transduction histidine kinase